MEGIGAPQPSRGLGSLIRRLEHEAVKGVRTVAYTPPQSGPLPFAAPPRRPLPHPSGIGLVVPPEPGSGFRGVAMAVDYRNEDPTGCGPAAVAGLLSHWGVGAAAEIPGEPCLDLLTRRYPPTMLGTSPQQITEAVRAEGLRSGGWVSGEAALRDALDRLLPAIALLDLRPIEGGLKMHWVMVTGYDAQGVHLANWSGADGDNRMSWAGFRAATATWTTQRIHTANRYLVVWP